jgi:thiosulfate/3-mercaptopyruvate sulfurtransferase
MAWQTLVSAENTAARLADPRLLIVDCRYDLNRPEAGRDAYLAAHLPGAIYADLEHDLSVPATPGSGRHPLPAADSFAARLRAWGVNDDSRLLAYDDSNGMYAARFWWMTARWLGHRHAAVLDGGLRRWLALGLPTTAEAPPRRPAGEFVGTPNPAAAVQIDTVAAAAQDPSRRVIDARAAERYRGEIEPIDLVAGHVPGARNHPYNRNIDADGRFLSGSEIRQALQATLEGAAPSDAIAMCGSGVTACHLLLAMEVAGLSGGQLYPGSWSEWSRDPSRPVAKGSEP